VAAGPADGGGRIIAPRRCSVLSLARITFPCLSPKPG
jgi:hypothetical protein